MIYLDQYDQPVQLGRETNRGGEGTIYEVSGSPEQRAKIYHRPANNEKAEKLRILSSLANPQLQSFTAIPVSTLRDCRTKRVAGFTMPNAGKREPVFQLSAPKSRKQIFPNSDYRFVTRVALNAARAFHFLHQSGIVIGDVNESGALVGNDGTVFLVDCDSFQVSANGKTFVCEVSVPSFTPPELQGKLTNVQRTAQQDCFGLAILIFNLLFMGRHPFAGRYIGPGEMSIEKAIAQRLFAYGGNSQMLPPPNTLALRETGSIAPLFERAFRSPQRPLAADWASALGVFEFSLRRCDLNRSHWFPGPGKCPWCRIEGATGIPLFANITIYTGTGDILVQLSQLWSAIDAVAPLAAMHFPSPPQCTASPEALEFARCRKRRLRFILLGWLAAVCIELILFVSGIAWLFFLIIVTIVFGTIHLGKYRTRYYPKASELRAEFQTTKELLGRLQSEWRLNEDNHAHLELKSKASGIKRQLMEVPVRRAAKLGELERDKRSHQLETYLDRFSIADANLDGIGKGRIALLRAEQIFTAADVTPVTRVPGFGPTFMGRLLAWRTQLETKFVFDPSRGVDQGTVTKVESEFAVQARTLSSALAEVPERLKLLNNRKAAKREAIWLAAAPLVSRLSQIEADLRAM